MIYNIHMKKRRNKNIFGDFFDKFENKFMRGRKEYEDEEYDDDDYETEEDGEYEDDSFIYNKRIFCCLFFYRFF